MVISRAILRADGVFLTRPAGFDDSSRRRRVAHSATTRRDPWNSRIRSQRQSSAPFRQAPVQSASSVSSYGSRMLTRLRKTSSPPPRAIRRTVWRARVEPAGNLFEWSSLFEQPQHRVDRLLAVLEILPTACVRPQLSNAGSMSSVADDLRMACMFWRTTSRKLAVSPARLVA